MGMPVLTTAMSAGCYVIPNVSIAWRNVLTNTTPIAAYRGAGRPEATYLIERAMDHIAYKLEMDPTEVRRQNYIPKDEKRERIARETLEIYAPLAERIGVTNLQHDLENDAFAVLHSEMNQTIQNQHRAKLQNETGKSNRMKYTIKRLKIKTK